MSEYFTWFGIGFIAWWVTGVDDFLVIQIYLKKANSSFEKWAVVVGTLISVLWMLTICFSADWVISFVKQYSRFLRLFGLIPIGFGIYGLWKRYRYRVIRDISPNDIASTGWISLATASFLTYFANSSDDIVFNTSLLQYKGLESWIMSRFSFGCGIMIGAVSTCLFALFLLRLANVVENRVRKGSWIKFFFSHMGLLSDVSIVAVGILILVGVFERS